MKKQSRALSILRKPEATNPMRPLFGIVMLMIASLAALCALPERAFSGYSRGGAFMAPGYGARGWGMGGAVVASGGDEGAVYWNPAYLACIEREQVGFSYVNLVPGAQARQSMLCYARSIRRPPGNDYGRRVSSHAAGFLYGNLSLELSDERAYSENVFRFAYAYTPDEFLSVGAAASILVSRSDIEEFDATGSAIDVGLRLQLSAGTSFGFVARNAASRVNYGDGYDETLGRQYTAAFSAKPRAGLLMELAAVFAHGSLSRATLGGEYALFPDVAFLRGALSSLTAGEHRLLPHVGLGFKLRRIILNYNANLDSDQGLDDTHRFTVSVQL